MHRWLHLTLAAPLMSFGGVAIDSHGPTRDFPSLSAVAGLLGNALGLDRSDRNSLQTLQNRLIYGALTARQGTRVEDNQNARVYDKEPGWTTLGRPEARNGGPSYSNPPLASQSGNQKDRKWLTHRRKREYLADHETRVVLRLLGGGDITLDVVAEALKRPARPLFIGRKACLPSVPLLTGDIKGNTVLDALQALGISGPAMWPDEGEIAPAWARSMDLADIRDWHVGLHSGQRVVLEGFVS